MKLADTSALCFVFLVLTTYPLTAQDGAGVLSYPKPKSVEQVDDYHGVKVADPYRWLEDTDSADTDAWVDAENKVRFGYLDLVRYRQPNPHRMTKFWNYYL